MIRYFHFWNNLNKEEQDLLKSNITEHKYKKGDNVAEGGVCKSLLFVEHGKLRVYTISEDGREITLYRLFDYDLCILSSSELFNSITFDIRVDAQEDSTIWRIPVEIYKNLMSTNLKVAAYTNEIMADKFSEVMWLLDQVLNKKMDQRIAMFLLEESQYKGNTTIEITHDQIARHLGTAREVVGRLVKYLQKEGAINSARGKVVIENIETLAKIAGQ